MNIGRCSLLDAVCFAIVLGGCSERDATAPTTAARAAVAAPEGRYVILFSAESVPAGFQERVAALGGSVEATLDSIGLAVAIGLTEAAAAELAAEAGVEAVEPDILDMPVDDEVAFGSAAPIMFAEMRARADATALLTASPTAAQFYARQWGMRAVLADKAWEAGFVGSSDVSVAILDTGIDYLHPDLDGRVDLSRSVSFVPTDDAAVASLFPGRHPITDLNSHGTAVTGSIVSNGALLAGVTQLTTVFGVKVRDRNAGGVLSNYLNGIYYAVNNRADVIHMTFVIRLSKTAQPAMVSATRRAIHFAHKKGAVLVTAAGNTGAAINVPGGLGDYDANDDEFAVCSMSEVICVAATGPTAAAGLNGPWTNVDAIAPYSNFGISAITVAAPGGTGPPGVQRALGIWLLCAQTTRVPCPAREGFIMSSTGTSWSAAMTSGVAALLVGALGKGKPSEIKKIIEKSADDLGAPGRDIRFGKGRINVARALGLID